MIRVKPLLTMLTDSEQMTNESNGRLQALYANFGGRARIRTVDPTIKSRLLYQLSYSPIARASKVAAL